MAKNFKWIIAVLVLLITATVATQVYLILYENLNKSQDTLYIYIDKDDTVDSVKSKTHCTAIFSLLTHLKYHPRTGRYAIEPNEKALDVFRKLRNGQQTPTNITIPSVRTLDRLAGSLAKQLMLDSTTIVDAFLDSTFCQEYGYTQKNFAALFIPNTYQIYWDVKLEAFMKRMQKEHNAYWTKERLQKAEAIGLNPTEVATLASIVDSETANDAEKPIIAGLYLNRLKKGILLQADPTVIFAVGDFSIRRVLNVHLAVESPYNTYLHKGLPPGPIRIASVVGLEAVLNHAEHNYLYMCAKEDFSGTHNFAATYNEHLRNARRYINALNARNIK